MKKFTRSRLSHIGCAAALGLMVSGQPAAADHPLGALGPVSFSWFATGAIGSFATPEANFGAGSFAADGTHRTSPIWAEAYLKPGLRGSYASDRFGTFYGVISVVAAGTIGAGDASPVSLTSGQPGQIALEEAYAGWSGKHAALQLGRQNFVIDDGFLINGGTVNAGRRADYYLYPRTAFDGIGVLKLNTSPFRADFFALRSNYDAHLGSTIPDSPKTDFAGFDAEWFENAPTAGADGSVNYTDRARYLNVTFLHVYDTSNGGAFTPLANAALPATDVGAARRNLNVAALSWGGNPLPPLPGVTFYATYVREFRARGTTLADGTVLPKADAEAYFAEPGYSFDTAPLKPRIFYRYSHFSGQKADTATSTAYDPLFYGGSALRMVFGTYYLGEIVGQYGLFNSNENVHQLGLVLNPAFHLLSGGDGIKFDLFYYHFMLDRPGAYGATASTYADELNLVSEYQYDAATYAAFVLGAAVPGAAAQQIAGSAAAAGATAGTIGGRTTGVAELFLTYAF